MPEQEPIDKRMLARLRDYSTPYQADAWDAFERFRARKDRRRPFAYWLRVAAGLLLLLGIGLGTERIVTKEKARKTPGIKKAARDIPNQEVSISKKRDSPLEYNEKQLPEKRAHSRRAATGNVATSRANATKAGQDGARLLVQKKQYPERISQGDRADTRGDEPIGGIVGLPMLSSMPATPYLVGLGKLYIRYAEPELNGPVPAKKKIRYGAGLSQNVNKAENTHLKPNFGLAAFLNIPTARKVSLTTGLAAGKQSLHIRNVPRDTGPIVTGTPQLQDVDHHWVNLELPLHLNFRLKTFKAFGLTAVGGVSVLGAFGQTSDYRYKTRRTITILSETTGGPIVVETQTIEELSSVTSDENRGKWTTGAALHLGLGLSYPVRSSEITLEPFFSYPVGQVTADKLRFTSFGLQLRMTTGSK